MVSFHLQNVGICALFAMILIRVSFLSFQLYAQYLQDSGCNSRIQMPLQKRMMMRRWDTLSPSVYQYNR